MIYLDNAATTPMDPRVEEVMAPYARDVFANPSSLHSAGRRARNSMDEARDRIADRLNVASREILFTSGATEANNLAIKGVARMLKDRGNHIITSAIEHPSVLESVRALAKEGFETTELLPDEFGRIQPEQVVEALRPDTILVSIMYANNEVGTIQPVAKIGKQCQKRGILFHTDAVQAAVELDLEVKRLHIDLMSISSHKLYGPKGVGCLYFREGLHLTPILHGGAQEAERRAGTENVAGVVGFSHALPLSDAEGIQKVRALRDRLLEGIRGIPGSKLYGDPEHRLSGHLSVGFEGVRAESLLMALDLKGIAVSTGSACSAGAIQPSHVLTAMGFSRDEAREVIRLTIGRFNTPEDIETTLEVLGELVPHLRR